MNFLNIIITISFSISLCSLFADDKVEAKETSLEFKPNTWVNANLKCELPKRFKRGSSTYFSKTDGYCDSVYRSKAGSIIIRTGIRCKVNNLNPGYYSNTSMEWNLGTNKIEAIDVFNWAGGSGGGGKLLTGFKDNPTPSPRHTYDGMAYVAEEDAMYMMAGANWKICLNKKKTNEEAIAQLKLDGNSTWKFTFADKKWTRIDGSIRQFWNGNRASPYESHMEYWPEGKKLLYFDARAQCYAEFDLKTQKWAKVERKKGKTGVSLYGARSSWDTKRGLWIFRNGVNVSVFNPKDKSFTKLPNCWELPPYPSKEKLKEMKKNKQKPDVRYHWKSIAYNAKHDVYVITGPTGNDTRVYNVEKKTWSEVKGGEIKLSNGYLEYDEKSDLFGLVVQHSAFKFRYVPGAMK
ncbi:MAG: hypothetical protein COA79_15615 [Planctomycetota bacterium]|nr:MAG: hypothetical protein COA79_15615 [Planctomycetota bacterium]